MEKQFITKKQLAAQMNCSIRTLTEWQRKGMPVAVRMGKRFVRYDYDEVAEWVRSRNAGVNNEVG